MLKKIYQELVLIRKELQAIKGDEESKETAKKYNPNRFLGKPPIR